MSTSTTAVTPAVALKKEEPPSALAHFAAGTMGGIFGLTLAYPLDTVKVRLQTRPAGTYSGIFNCMTTMAKTEGAGSLYRGLASPVAGYGLIKATAFASYNQAKQHVLASYGDAASTHKLTLAELTVCGAFAGFCQTFVRAPVEQIKIVMQSRNKPGSTAAPYSSTFACIADVTRSEGIFRGFYRAFWPTLAREIPQYAIYYPTYELACRLFLQPGQAQDTLSPVAIGLAGGLAGVAQWAPTYSLDVVKSKVSAAPPGTYTSTWDCAVRSYKAEGIPVFFRGISAALLRAFPLHAAVFLGYELSMKLLK